MSSTIDVIDLTGCSDNDENMPPLDPAQTSSLDPSIIAFRAKGFTTLPPLPVDMPPLEPLTPSSDREDEEESEDGGDEGDEGDEGEEEESEEEEPDEDDLAFVEDVGNMSTDDVESYCPSETSGSDQTCDDTEEECDEGDDSDDTDY